MSGSSEGSAHNPATQKPPSASVVAPFLAPAAGGIRYAQVQAGGPLLYSPSLFGQSMLPWRSIPTSQDPHTPTPPHPHTLTGSPSPSASSTAGVSSSSPPSQPPTSTPSLLSTLTSLTQLSGLIYPVVPPPQPIGKKDAVKTSGSEGVNKRRTDGSLLEMELKRPRLSDPVPHPSTSSTSSPSRPHTSTTPRQHHVQQRSPVIKFIPYNPGQSVVLPPGVVAAQRGASSSLPQAVLLPTMPSQATAPTTVQSPRPAAAAATATPLSASVQAPPNVTVETIQKLAYKLPVMSNISSVPNQAVATATTTATPPASHSALANSKIVLLKCFGPMQTAPDPVFNQNNLVVSSLLQDLYRPSYFTTSDYSRPGLSPESSALLTICYLTSLQQGESISLPSIRAMMHYAQIGEIDWLNYHKKHKKMSESTFVQAQLMHLSRVAVYPVLGRVRVMISNQSLADGISQTLQTLGQLANISRQNLPDYVVVMAIRPSSSIDFCILVLEPLQVQILIHLSGTESKLNKHHMLVFQNPVLPDLHVEKELAFTIRSVQKKHSGRVLIPFYNSKHVSELESSFADSRQLRMESEKAAELVPDAPHVIEHKPQGPFQDQYGMATTLLQYLWGAKMKISNFRKIDFCILCPPEASFVSQTVAMVAASGLVEQLELYVGGERECISAINQRVICCNLEADGVKFRGFLSEVEANPTTLYVVVAENGHMTSTIATGLTNEDASSPDNARLLLHLDNTVVLLVSAHPFALLTNRSFLSPSNEVHWPVRPQATGKSLEDTSLPHFCSAGNYRQDLTNQIDYGVRFREDSSFEDMFHQHCTSLGTSVPVALVTVRAELLLNQYARALVFASGVCPSSVPALPDTQELVNRLVQAPLNSTRGQGCMLLIRSHDRQVGEQFYRQLKAVRNSLGLQFRFEVLFDDGSHFITPAPHFLARTPRKGRGCSHGNESRDHVMSYQELEGVPCVVVLAGKERANLSFPESLLYVDLRMCYPSAVTRCCYDYDTSFFNGYRTPVKKTTPLSSELTNHRSPTEPAVDMEDSDCDVEVFDDGSHDPSARSHDPSAQSHDRPSRPVKLSSSTVSRRSSADNEESNLVIADGSPLSPPVRHSVLEWKPGNAPSDGAGSSPVSSHHSEDNENQPINNHDNYPGTVTVTIDPPADPLLYSRDGSDSPLRSSSHCQEARLPFLSSPPDEGGTEGGYLAAPPAAGGQEEGGQGDSDSEDEGGPPGRPAPSRLCLLSRSYYHIWSSHSPQAQLLLNPAPGVDWHGGSHRPPLFDTDPHQQSAYYHKWSKPGSREVRHSLDRSVKETARRGRRPFLLSGPPQVGKTGAWLLMIRLLHDILRSTQGVVVENLSPPGSIFMDQPPTTPSAAGKSENSNTVPLLGGSQSKIVPLSCLKDVGFKQFEDEKSLKAELQRAVETEGVTTATVSEVSPNSARHTLLLPVSPYMAYDHAHSCADCSKHLRPSSAPSSHQGVDLLTFRLPTPRNKSHVTLQWYVPAHHQRHCVLSSDRRSLERLKIPLQRSHPGSATPLTPIFTPSIRRESLGLLNLFHSVAPSHLHVVVVLQSEFDQYCKVWPGHLMLVMPEAVQSKGAMFQLLCDFIRYNFQLCVGGVSSSALLRGHEAPPTSLWPMVAVISDSVAMVKKVDADGRLTDLSVSQLLLALEEEAATPSLAALSLLPWSQHLEQDPSLADALTNFDLSHDFLLLNSGKLASSAVCNDFAFNSSAVDFNLKLQATAQRTRLHRNYVFVKKHIANSGNVYPLHTQLTRLCPNVNKLVISLHHDSSSLLPHPGPYLMEHYLLHKSTALFPYACYARFPVLVVDNYVSLGPRTHVTFVQSNMLSKNSFMEHNGLQGVKFGGLLLYLCEGNLTSDQLLRLDFVRGASLCLVARDCKALIREVARLDLEEWWKFRLRDEYQTACGDHLRPLFFITGCFEK